MPRTTKPKLKSNRIVKKQISKPETTSGFPLTNDPAFGRLNHRQRKFVYNIFLQPITQWSNGKCYSDAYDNPNMDVCYQCALENLRKPDIAACVAKIREAYHSELYTNADRILREEASIAYSDPAEFFDKDGHLVLPIHKLPMQVRKSISGFEVIESPRTGTIRYKVTLWNKGQSLGRLQSVAGMNAAKKMELSGPGGGPIDHRVQKIEIVLIRPGVKIDK